jgi:hypothetical protein
VYSVYDGTEGYYFVAMSVSHFLRLHDKAEIQMPSIVYRL